MHKTYKSNLPINYFVTLLCYFVTLLFCPLHQSGKDLSLLLKLSKVGALTTADGKSFQELTTLFEKKFFLTSVLAKCLVSLKLCPRVIDVLSLNKLSVLVL
jgi:fluoride ion exporter CrcB/FEX